MMVVAYFNVLSRHLPVQTNENTKSSG